MKIPYNLTVLIDESTLLILVFFFLILILFGLLYLIRARIDFSRKLKPKYLKNVYQKGRSKALPLETFYKLQDGLKKFELNKEFTSKKLSLNKLSKELNTNTSYLSFYINTYKECRFNEYINNLRIKEAHRLINEDSKFRNYTIKAISNEVGYKNPRIFSREFKKVFGVYPSTYLEGLKKF